MKISEFKENTISHMINDLKSVCYSLCSLGKTKDEVKDLVIDILNKTEE